MEDSFPRYHQDKTFKNLMLKRVIIGGDVVLGKPWTPNEIDRDAISQKMLYLSPIF